MKCPECERENKPFWSGVYGLGIRYYKCECGMHWNSDDKKLASKPMMDKIVSFEVQKELSVKKISDETAKRARKHIELLARITSISAEEAQEIDEVLADLADPEVKMKPGRYEGALSG